jgi:hypothetical protein
MITVAKLDRNALRNAVAKRAHDRWLDAAMEMHLPSRFDTNSQEMP